ncbi:transporter MCH4 [Fusarium circinatum]|uniref:Transporter MCH4 n=1 Tax=Fusarium circinatum TaxID=48490 RepID=A0A8H5XE24_FUSCI|nr:transporter MCH4 [Fusarium circinatum]
MDADTEQAKIEDTNPEQPKPRNEFPDGGLKAWTVVIGAFCGLFVSFGWTNCVGVFQAYYEANQLQDLSPSTVSWIPALSMFMMFITAPFIGRGFDIFGPRYLLLTGTLLHVFGLMMASISSKYYQFILSQAICSPLGAAMVLYPSFSCVTTWFRQKRALALGITASGSSLGAGFFYSMGMFIPITFMVTYGEHVGLSNNMAGYLVSIFNASSHESAIAFAALFGFSSGTYTAISPALIAHISDLEEIGTRSGTMYAFMSVAALTGSPIGGALISSADGSYWKLQVFAGCMIAAGMVGYIAARLYITKGKLWVKV